MYALRLWSVRHARGLWRVYRALARLAPLLRPCVRVFGAARMQRLLAPIERRLKGLFFDCRMCGQCVLSATGMACPMNCPKQMRNGPCGGVRANGHCEVDPDMRCVWVEATHGLQRIAPVSDSAGVSPLLPPLDRRQQGQSTWVEVVHGRIDAPRQSPVPERSSAASRVSALAQACREGRFVFTVEVAPPDSANPQDLLARAAHFKGCVDAINITDGAGGNCHMSSVAASAILAANGFEPVYQIACRDRNRIAIQGDLIGAAALGIQNILCLTGDDVSQGDHPEAKPVFDLDAVSLLHIARGMCEQSRYASGRTLTTPPDWFIGASANPFVPPHADRLDNLEKKILAGARFIQTQFCFDVPAFERFMQALRARGLHQQAHILVGVGTLGNARALQWMAQHVPGVHVPTEVIERVGAASDPRAEGQRLCLETIERLRQIDGVAGVHVMGHKNEATLAEIIQRARERA